MSKPMFSNEILCKFWVQTAAQGGSRRDVVTKLLAHCELPDNPVNRKKLTNNMTQRVRQLSKHKTTPINFPKLSASERVNSAETMKGLQAILDSAAETAIV